VIHGDGRQTRDFVPVGEVVGAFLHATLGLADAARAPHIAGGALNIGLGRETSLLELVRLIGDAAGFHATPRLGPSRPGDVRRSCADLSRSRALLGYAPTASLADSLAELVEWMRVPQA
jgi:UDP-glucose 4-epimerase